MKKQFAAIAAIVLLIVAGLAATNSGIQSIDRTGSHVRIDRLGEIRIEPRSDKSVTFTRGTKSAQLDLSNITDGTTRTVTFPNANSTTVQPNTGAANQFLTAISALGVVSRAQPAFTDISGTAAAAQIPTALNSVTFATGKTVALTDADSLTVGGVIVPQQIAINFGGLGASSASGDQVFMANRAFQVTAIRIVQRTQGGSGCVADVEKLTGTTAPGSGTVLGTGSYNCNTTANNTVTLYTLTGTTATLQLAVGDRLGVKLGGTLTALAGLNITIQLKPI